MRRGTLLVADRNPRFVERTEEILRGAGYRVVGVVHGDAAREALRAGSLDGVLVHAALPGLGGLALCRLAKERDPSLPVVVMLSADEEALADEAERAGADNVLVRPLRRSEVLHVARALVAQRALMVRLAQLASELAATRREATDVGRAVGAPGQRLVEFELFKRMLHIEVKRARRYGFALALLIAALDGARRPGDRDALAGAVRGAVRDIDILVAFGATDVLVVLPHTDREGAVAAAERIRERVRGGRWLRGCTASIAVVCAEGARPLSFATLLAQATRALRQAAREGGDRVIAA